MERARAVSNRLFPFHYLSVVRCTSARSTVLEMADKDAAFRDWCKSDGVSQLQSRARNPPASSLNVTTSTQPIHRSHQRPTTNTPKNVEPVPYAMHTDHMAAYHPPKSTAPAARNPQKYDALARSGGWAPHTSNRPGAQRAVYDPVSHKTTLYTFDQVGGVSWVEGNGDKLMRDKALTDAQAGEKWHGRRKGVVEFVDRTHPSAVNQNDDFRKWCAIEEHAYHTPTGELTKWMDNAFLSKMKVPFYGKQCAHPNRRNAATCLLAAAAQITRLVLAVCAL